MFDLIVFIIIALYGLKGYKKGGIYASFQFIGYFVAFIVAFLFSGKFSVLLSQHIDETNTLLLRTLPFITYILLFFGIIYLAKIVAKSIKSLNKVLLLGWLDRLVGVFIYVCLVLCFGSIVIWIGYKLGFVDDALLQETASAETLLFLGEKIISNVSNLLPFIKENAFDLLAELDKYKT